MESDFELTHADAEVDAETEQLVREVIGAAIEVHRLIGPGFPESVYRNALSRELRLRGVEHQCEVVTPVVYKGVPVGEGRIDLLVGNRIIIELKTVEKLNEVYVAQVIAYLQARKLRLGILLNFNVAALRKGIKRILNPHLP